MGQSSETTILGDSKTPGHDLVQGHRLGDQTSLKTSTVQLEAWRVSTYQLADMPRLLRFPSGCLSLQSCFSEALFPASAEIQPRGFSRYLSGRSQWKPAAAHSCWWASKDKTVQSASSRSWGSRYHWISLGCSLHPTRQRERRQKFSDQTQINHPSERWWPEKKKKIKEIKDEKELQFTSLSDRHLCGPNINRISQPLGLTSKSYICLCSYDTWQYLKNDFSLW